MTGRWWLIISTRSYHVITFCFPIPLFSLFTPVINKWNVNSLRILSATGWINLTRVVDRIHFLLSAKLLIHKGRLPVPSTNHLRYSKNWWENHRNISVSGAPLNDILLKDLQCARSTPNLCHIGSHNIFHVSERLRANIFLVMCRIFNVFQWARFFFHGDMTQFRTVKFINTIEIQWSGRNTWYKAW